MWLYPFHSDLSQMLAIHQSAGDAEAIYKSKYAKCRQIGRIIEGIAALKGSQQSLASVGDYWRIDKFMIFEKTKRNFRMS
jgi:hypothetical protein